MRKNTEIERMKDRMEELRVRKRDRYRNRNREQTDIKRE